MKRFVLPPKEIKDRSDNTVTVAVTVFDQSTHAICMCGAEFVGHGQRGVMMANKAIKKHRCEYSGITEAAT